MLKVNNTKKVQELMNEVNRKVAIAKKEYDEFSKEAKTCPGGANCSKCDEVLMFLGEDLRIARARRRELRAIFEN